MGEVQSRQCKWRRFLAVALLAIASAVVLVGFFAPETETKRHPNIVLILVDDLG